MIRTKILLLLLLVAFTCLSQNKISVKSFTEDPTGTTAVVHPVIDPGSGDKCALIIVTNVEVGGYHFDFGGVYAKVDERIIDGRATYLIYVAPGVRKVTISNSNSTISTLRDYRFPMMIKKAKTYNMELGEVYLSTQKQYLEFSISPSNAYLEVNGEPWKLDENGYVSKSVPFGKYNYLVKADDFHTEPGVVDVNDPSRAVKVNLTLRPAYGFLTINGGKELDGANIFIDEKPIGTGNITKSRLASGSHTLKIGKDLYNPYQETVVIKDNEETVIRPMLDGNFAQAHVIAKGKDIYLDGKKLAQDEWYGKLVPGDYVFEARKNSHRPSRKQVTVHRKGENIEVVMPEPEPIYGRISVETTPPGAQIKLDGVLKGVTPLSINDVLVGQYEVEVSMKGYQPVTETIVVEDGLETNFSKVLNNLITLQIVAPNSQSVFVDGTKYELTLGGKAIVLVEAGNHTISAYPVNSYYYKQFTETGKFDSNASVYVKHKRILHQRKDFYFLLGGTVGSLKPSPEAVMGFHLGKFCCEFGYANIGLTNSIDGIYLYRKGTDGEWKSAGDCWLSLENVFIARAGMRFMMSQRFDITPLIGYRCIVDEEISSISASVRFNYMFRHHFGVAFTPEYYKKIGANYSANMAAHYDNSVKSFMSGFNFNVSFVIMF